MSTTFLMKKGILYIFHMLFQIALFLKIGVNIIHNHIYVVYNKDIYILPCVSLLISRFKIRFFRNTSFGSCRSHRSSLVGQGDPSEEVVL